MSSATTPPSDRDTNRNGGRAADAARLDTDRQDTARVDAGDRGGPGAAAPIPDGPGHTPAARDVVAAQKDRFGGMKFGSCFFGWLTATGTAVLLTALLTAAGAAVGLSQSVTTTEAQQNVSTLGLAGGIALLVVVLVAYLAGGYVAGRMARFNGLRQGLGVWLWSLIAAAVVAVLTLVAGARYNVLGNLNGFPRIPVDEGTLSTGGIIAAIILVVAALVGALLGGLAGMRFHRRVDRATHDDALRASTTSR